MSMEMGTLSPNEKNWQSASCASRESSATTQSEVQRLAAAGALSGDVIVDT